MLNFGQALEAMKQGKKVKREHWGGYWFIPTHAELRPSSECSRDERGRKFVFNKMIVAKLKDNGGYAPAQAYQADLLANDWELV